MRLLSATVRNYRIHKEVNLDFDGSLTLVGGRNESGKSTLAEAIHRGLFLKATTGGKIQESMQSDLHAGHPEVEVRFSAAGKTWEIRKIFSKTSGKATLSEDGGTAIHGPEAESQLAQLMQVEEPGGGVGGAKTALAQWAHLWVWQGSGGEDPSEHAAPQRDALLSRLKEEGGGAVMQSDLDSQVVNRFQSEFEAIFTKTGQPKAGSELSQAIQDKEASSESLAEAESDLQRLQTAMIEFQEAENILESGGEKLSQLEGQLAKTQKKQKQASELQHRFELEQRNCDEAKRNLEQFSIALQEIATLRAELKKLSEKSQPNSDQSKALDEKWKTLRKGVEDAATELEAAEKKLAQTRELRELAEAWGQLLKQREQLARFEEIRSEIESLEIRQKKIRESLAALPRIDEATYRRLQQVESEHSEAQAVLAAMSTGIEVVQSDRPVTLGAETLVPGKEEVIDRESVLSIGDEIALRISPGGGKDLESARTEFAQLRSTRESVFREAGVETISDAATIRSQRSTLDSELRDLQAQLEAKEAGDLRERINETSRETTRYEAEIERRSSTVEDFSPPQDSAEARRIWESIRDELAPLESQALSAKKHLSDNRDALEVAEGEREDFRRETEQSERKKIEMQALLQAKEEPLGTPEEGQAKAEELAKKHGALKAQLTRLQGELNSLQPETIDADLERFGRAMRQKKEELETAGQQRAVAMDQLSSDGSKDPALALARAKALAESAVERHRSLERRAEAIRLLRDLFASEQQKLSDQFSRPLARRVSGYLQQIFGPSASATVMVEDGVIGGWKMTRDSGTFDFSDLSGGTREQVAAAVRLALAEILAEDHEGSLPIVFDDAFTNSDPDRIESLQRMLDLASRSGLQIILLTCTPDDYIGLGAKTVTLSPIVR